MLRAIMGGSWKIENHIKLLYCLHFITLLIITLCFVYTNIINARTCQYYYQDDISRPAPTVGRSPAEIGPPSEEIVFQQRTKRNPILTDDPTVDDRSEFYQYNLKELLEQESKKSTDKPKRKRLKLRIMFNETNTHHPDIPLTNGQGDPTIVSLPSEQHETKSGNDPWIMIPIYSKMNYLKDFCFSLHDFCDDGKSRPTDSSETSTLYGAITTQAVSNEIPQTIVVAATTSTSNTLHTYTVNVTEDIIDDVIAPSNKTLLDVVQIDAIYFTTSKSADNIISSTTVAMVADKDAVNYYDEIEGKNEISGKQSIRKRKKCFIHQIGKPIEIGYRKNFWGAWMRDARPRFERDEDKRWVMEHFSGIYLLEYANEDDLYKPELSPVKVYTLPHMFEGTSHVMYYGSLYYQRALSPVIIRYDLYRNYTRQQTISGTSYRGSSHLYAENLENYFDLAVDENGLWVIYRYEGVSYLSVARLHPKTLKILRIWNLTEIDTNQIGNCWVTCGVVYMVKSGKVQNTTLHFAYDLYKQQYARLDNVEWTNVYSNANMISYNPIDRKMYIYDNGHLIMIPLLLNFDVD